MWTFPALKGAYIQITPLIWDSFLLPVMDRHQVDPLGNVSAGAPRQRGACRSRITLAGPGGKPAGAFDEKPNVGTSTKGFVV
jgi:hypothetical protein